LILAQGWACPAVAVTIEQCRSLIDASPEAAIDFASDPAHVGGANNAKLCQAEAYIALNKPAQAAALYLDLAGHIPDKTLSLDLYRKSAWQYALANEEGKAKAALVQALALDPGNIGILYDRAAIESQTEDFWSAKTDLDTALSRIEPLSQTVLAVKIYILKAKIDKALGQRESAESDLEEALSLAPRELDALLNRGILRAEMGDVDGAKRDWQSVLEIGPNSEQAPYAHHLLNIVDKPKPEN